MLLASDGSTTILLEAMIGEDLQLQLEEVSVTSGKDIAPDSRSALRIDRDTPVKYRVSGLVTRSLSMVSRNHVVAPIGKLDKQTNQMLDAAEPIGRTMNAGRAGHRRLLLDSGWSTWRTVAGEHVPCAFKSYVILEDAEPVVHIVEHFNPTFVPNDGHPDSPRRPETTRTDLPT